MLARLREVSGSFVHLSPTRSSQKSMVHEYRHL